MYNKRMNEQELSVAVQNEKEWRKLIFRKLENVEESQIKTEKRVMKLELKNAFFGSMFGFIAGIIATYVKTKS